MCTNGRMGLISSRALICVIGLLMCWWWLWNGGVVRGGAYNCDAMWVFFSVVTKLEVDGVFVVPYGRLFCKVVYNGRFDGNSWCVCGCIW